jgi:hypothetical protein
MYDMVRWLGPRTHPGELCFGHPPLEFLLGLQSAGYIPYANGGDYTPPAQVQQLLEELSQQNVPLVLLSAMAYMPQPGSPDHLLPFRSYLLQNYRLVKVLGGATEVWVRKGVELPQP